MKIAASTSDGKTIADHFGHAAGFVVVTLENGKVTNKEERGLSAGNGQETHCSEHAAEHKCRSDVLLEMVPDCNLVLSGGMCDGAFSKIQRAALEPILTGITEIDEAVQAYLDGNLVSNPELISKD